MSPCGCCRGEERSTYRPPVGVQARHAVADGAADRGGGGGGGRSAPRAQTGDLPNHSQWPEGEHK